MVFRDGDGLFAGTGPRFADPMTPLGDGRFAFSGNGRIFRFLADDTGRVDRVLLTVGGEQEPSAEWGT